MSTPDANGWMPIEQEPDTDGPFDVLLYFPAEAMPDFDGADYQTQIGRWDRRNHRDIFSGWFHQGTNHDCFEHWAVENGQVPTHWQPLPKPPVAALQPATDTGEAK
jgi:hypothetical protein